MYFRRYLQLTGSVILALLLTSCANSSRKQSTTNIPAFKSAATSFDNKTNKIRLSALKATARSVGAQAALAWEANNTNKLLTEHSEQLSQIFNFRSMMLKNNVMPPILEESKNTLNLHNDSTIRLSDRVYRIIQPAHFVTVVPLWHNYLWMNFAQPEPPNSTLLPKTDEERDIWNKYIIIGWKEGLQQAQDIFTINLNRLTRDYKGIILYRKLLAQNIVTRPFVSKANLGITGGGDNMRINDQVLRITAVSKLQPNSKIWKSRLYKLRKRSLVGRKPTTKKVAKKTVHKKNYHVKKVKKEPISSKHKTI